METELLWKARILRLPYKTIEDKFEMLEWAIRFSEYVGNDEHQKFMSFFRELYTTTDLNLRNAYIQATHLNDTVVYVTDIIDKEFSKIDYQMGLNDARVTLEKKVNVCLVALESLIVNDKNLEIALEGNLL